MFCTRLTSDGSPSACVHCDSCLCDTDGFEGQCLAHCGNIAREWCAAPETEAPTIGTPGPFLYFIRQVPLKGHHSNVFKRLYKRLKNILEYNSFFTSVKKKLFSFCKDVTVMHILTK